MELILWQNLIFLVPLLTGALYTVLLALSGGGDVGGEGPDADLDADTDGDADGGHGALAAALEFLGVGRVPLSLLLTSAVLLWGAAGLISNLILGLKGVWVSVVVASVVTVLGTRAVARLVARLIPSVESYGATRSELWGEVGLALYSVTATGGTVRLRDRRNNLLDLECRAFPGEPDIPAGSRVRLEEYDDTTDVYRVRAVAG